MTLSLRPLGKTGLNVSPLAFGAFKIGRNEKIKYPQPYDLPDDRQVTELLDGLIDLGINFIDTAPAYGQSEERIGRWLANRRRDTVVLSTKVGETFANGVSAYDFSSAALHAGFEASCRRLGTDWIDLLLIHSPGDDLEILHNTDAVAVLQTLKQQGKVRVIGLSGKSVAGARGACEWADVLMVEYHIRDTSHAQVMAEAAARGIGILVKKALAAGHLPPDEALKFVYSHAAVGSVVVGGLSLEHFRTNAQIACRATGEN